MKELQLGIMNKKQLAEWFGVKYKTFCQSKEYLQKKLIELEKFANFKIIDNKEIKILEIYEPIYVKNGEKINREIKKLMVKDVKPNIPFTCTQLGDKYFYLFNKRYGGTEGTYVYRTRKTRDELWGKPEIYTNCHRELAKMYKGKTPKDNTYVLLTSEEIEVSKQLYEEMYGTIFDNFTDFLFSIDEYVDNLKSTEELLEELKIRNKMYKKYLYKLSIRLNCDYVVSATIIDDTSLILNEKDFNF